MTDSITKFVYDSATNYHHIVDTANTVLNVIPPVNPVVDAVKLALVALGGFFTARGIHFFKNRNKK